MMKYLKRTLMYVFIASISTSYAQDDYFVSTWDTRLSGKARYIDLTRINGIIDVDTDMDGTFDLIGIDRGKIRFTRKGIHTIAIRPNVANTTLSTDIADEGLLRIEKWGSIVWRELSFSGCTNMTIADDAGVPDLTMCLYTNFTGGTSLIGNNLHNWDVSNIATMTGTFAAATSFNADISSWNVSKVTYMPLVFESAISFNRDLSTWSVSNVTSMDSTFRKATSFNADISSWNVSKVTNMKRMFEGAISFNRDLSAWNVSKVWTMSDMLTGATSFNSDLSSWDVSTVYYMENMFTGATSFSSENYDALLTGWANLPSLQPNVIFGAPPTTYCAGKAGRDKLTRPVADGGYNWTITGDLGEDCSPVTSVDEEFLSNTKIYPNSTNGKISIESSFEIDKLELYNILGAKLFSVSKTNALDLKSLKQGIYILKVFSEDRVINKKIIKN